jgi:hypothetical protein
LKRQAAAVEIARGNTEPEAKLMSDGIFDTTSSLQAV